MGKEFKDVYSATDSIKIGEKTYITGKITIGDIILFQNFCDREAKKDLIDLYKMTGEKIDMKELRSLTADTEFYDQKSQSVEGVIFLFTSIIKRLNKDVDEDYLRNNITIKDVERISTLISEEEVQEETDKDENFPQKKKIEKTD